MLLEAAPLRLLSLHHTGLSNADISTLCNLLTSNPTDCCTQAYLNVLTLGPPVRTSVDSSSQQQSETVQYEPATLQKLLTLPGQLPELQVLPAVSLHACHYAYQNIYRFSHSQSRGLPIVPAIVLQQVLALTEHLPQMQGHRLVANFITV